MSIFLIIHLLSLSFCLADVFVTLATNGYVYETFGISKHFPVKLQVLLIRAKTLDNPLTAKCFIYDVCAQYGHLISKISHYSRGCKSLTGKLAKPVSKSQAGSP